MKSNQSTDHLNPPFQPTCPKNEKSDKFRDPRDPSTDNEMHPRPETVKKNA